MTAYELSFRDLIYLIEFISVIVATLTYKSYKNTPSKIIMPFLWFTIFTEMLGKLPRLNRLYGDGVLINFFKKLLPSDLITSNAWIIGVYSIVSFYVFLWYYRNLTKSDPSNKYINFLIVLYTSFVIIDHIKNYQFFNSHLHMLIIHKIAGVLCTLIASFIYLQTVFKRNEIFTFHKTLPFWITVGVIFFNLLTTPIFIYANYFKLSESIYPYILTTSSIIMYGCFIIGFILCTIEHKKNKLEIT